MYYQLNKAKSRTVTTQPTKTDQAGAGETSLHTIISRYGVSGQMPVTNRTPITGDLTKMPTELREVFQMARSMRENRAKLPKQLRELPLEQLLALTREELDKLLKPASPPAPKEEKKE